MAFFGYANAAHEDIINEQADVDILFVLDHASAIGRQQVAIVWSLLLLSADALPALQQTSWFIDDLNQNLGRDDTASRIRLRTCLLSGYPGSSTQRCLTADHDYDNVDRQMPHYAWAKMTSGTSMRTCLLSGYPGPVCAWGSYRFSPSWESDSCD